MKRICMEPHSIAQKANRGGCKTEGLQLAKHCETLRLRATSFIRTIRTVGFVGSAPWETHQGHSRSSVNFPVPGLQPDHCDRPQLTWDEG